MRLLSDKSIQSSAGARPVFMYVIAVDDNGTREEQKSLESIASFTFVNSDEQAINYTSTFTESVTNTSFQHYSYALPQLEEDAEGRYTLRLGSYIPNCMMLSI